eukprot:8061620-Alexandrium_andersonii.AAC.1
MRGGGPGGAARRLRLFLYNPLAATSTGRIAEIAKELRADAIFLPGTQIKEWEERRLHAEKID